MKTKKEILEQVKIIKESMKSEDDYAQGISETELELLWIELKELDDPMYKGFSKHPW